MANDRTLATHLHQYINLSARYAHRGVRSTSYDPKAWEALWKRSAELVGMQKTIWWFFFGRKMVGCDTECSSIVFSVEWPCQVCLSGHGSRYPARFCKCLQPGWYIRSKGLVWWHELVQTLDLDTQVYPHIVMACSDGLQARPHVQIFLLQTWGLCTWCLAHIAPYAFAHGSIDRILTASCRFARSIRQD